MSTSKMNLMSLKSYRKVTRKNHYKPKFQINFRHAWIDNTINGEVEKLDETGSGTRRANILFTTFCI